MSSEGFVFLAALTLLGCTDPTPGPAISPPAPTHRADEVSFLVIGDAGHFNEGAEQVAESVERTCATLGCDFLVLVGDNLYYRGMESPEDPRMAAAVSERYPEGLPIYLALGNHDYGHGRNVQAVGWQVQWASRTEGVHLPSTRHSMETGPAAFYFADTNATFQWGARSHIGWLQSSVSQSTKPWQILFGHHPYKSNGRHGNAGSYEGWSGVPWLSGNSVKEFYEKAVCGEIDIAFAGHDHNRQVLEACGTTFVVSGAGAKTTPIIDRGNNLAFGSAELGVVHVQLSATSGTVRNIGLSGTIEHIHSVTPADRTP